MPLPRWCYFYLTAFLTDASLFMITLAAPQVALARFDCPATQLGLLGTLSGLGYSVLALMGGWTSDRIDRRLLPRISTAAQALCLLAIPFTPGFGSFLILNILYMAIVGLFWAPLMGLLSVVTPRAELSRVLGRYNLSWCSGGLTGAFAAGELLERVGPGAPFVAAGLLALFSMVILLIGRPAEAASAASTTTTTEPPSAAEPFASAVPAQARRSATAPGVGESPHPRALPMKHQAWLVMSCAFLLVSLTLYLFPKLAQEELGWGPRRISLLQGCRIGAMLAAFGLMGITRGWHFRRAPYHACFGLMLLGIGAIAASGQLAFSLVAFIGLGAATGMAYVLSAYYSMLSPAGRGSMLGIHEALLSSGNVLGPILGGWVIAGTGDLRAPFWWALVPVALAWGAYGLWARRLSR